MTELIIERITEDDREKFAPLILADYYEIQKELMTAILLIDGYKTLNHKDLIEYVRSNNILPETSIMKIDRLRVIRHRIAYEGRVVDPAILKRNRPDYNMIIRQLRKVVENRIKQ